jgi:hypothetical protein
LHCLQKTNFGEKSLGQADVETRHESGFAGRMSAGGQALRSVDRFV